MSRAEVEQLDDRGMAAWDQHDTAAFTALLADEFTFSDVMAPEAFINREQVQEYMEGWFTAFPDMRAKTTNRVVTEDQVAAEVEFTGTNTGPLRMGNQELPATGKPVTGTGTYFASVKDGKFVSFRVYPDVAGMMGQLGMMPGM
ncbi:ester cyclase [Arthrobacter sp. ISL-28]|uniref:ester cyclase n=1 Tax=Arthrobacter sp. ISL-28 TaxID=2819108 RepID=UPI001BE8DDEA|nr:ester cyclase [Arthrobacter sp. ISL-28]MBT2519754.1 ester cyclase [Arthrobacter sp. ISL-28]